MKAWLVVNEFLNQSKFHEIYEWLFQAGVNRKVEFSIKTNGELLAMCQSCGLSLQKEIPMVDFVLFWDKDIILAKTLEARGYRVFNSSRAIEVCDNKTLTHFYLAKENIPMPDTIFAPMTYENIGYTRLDFVEQVIEQLGEELIIKESFGSFGQQVYLCKNRQEVFEKVKQLQGKSFLFQKYMKGTGGRDVRLQVVGNRVVAAMERRAKEGDFRANITNGGSMKKYSPSKEEQELAVRCCEVLKVDFAGVDLLFDEQGKAYVCEVNSNAHFKNIYDCTGVNVADFILEHIIKQQIQKGEDQA